MKFTDKLFLDGVEEYKRKSFRNLTVDIRTYLDMECMVDMGMTLDYKEFCFAKVWLYGWIKGALRNVRKN